MYVIVNERYPYCYFDYHQVKCRGDKVLYTVGMIMEHSRYVSGCGLGGCGYDYNW